jgi:hypothetical protein
LVVVVAVHAGFFGAGCGFAHLQSPRTLPPGATRVTVGDTLVTSGLRNAHADPWAQISLPFNYIPPDFQLRHGLSDRVDIGGRLLLGIGAVVDVKVNLLPPGSRAALALSAGVGGAVGLGHMPTWIAHVPATLAASYDVAPWFVPYAAVGYRSFWIFRSFNPNRPTDPVSDPSGSGEGVVMVYLGIELRRASGRALLLEYGRLIPAVHDPGHGYEFVPANLFSIGFRTGEGSAFER